MMDGCLGAGGEFSDIAICRLSASVDFDSYTYLGILNFEP